MSSILNLPTAESAGRSASDVIPEQAGIHCSDWIPACAGMTHPSLSRRRFLLALAACPVLAWANSGPENPIGGFQRWGTGEFRRFGFLVYEATLWAGGDDPQRPPLAIKLTYKRNIAGKAIAEASVKEIRNLGIADESRLQAWGELMTKIFPDVRPGDHILGLNLPEGARFFYNDQAVGKVDDPAFARAFFAIWLDPKTSAPDLRAALLKRPAG